jgi:hypothetical protein
VATPAARAITFTSTTIAIEEEAKKSREELWMYYKKYIKR